VDSPTFEEVDSEGAVGPEEVLGALKRVMASDQFRTSRRSSAFLAFVVTETVAGRGSRLKERTVARYALERGPDFDPRTDAIVRVQAGRVRDSLVRYYDTAGAADPIRILLSPGSYEPTFVRHLLQVPLQREEKARSARGTEVAVVRFREIEPGAGPFSAVGVCESLVDALGQFPGLRVRGPIDATVDGTEPEQFIDVGTRLGVSYVVHGSLRVGHDRVRVTARMTDVSTGRVIWSQTFDRGADDFSGFLGEDDLVHHIVEIIAGYGGVLQREADVVGREDRWGEVFRATADFYRFVEDSAAGSHETALAGLHRALELEPDHPELLGMLSACHCVGAMLGYAPDRAEALGTARALARRAVALDDNSPRALMTLGLVSLAHGDQDEAREFARRAAGSWPQRPPTLFTAGVVTMVSGDWETGIGMMRDLMRSNPSQIGRLHIYLALDALLHDDDPTALVEANLVPAASPWGPFLRGLAHAGLGFQEAAARELGDAEAMMPGFVSEHLFAEPRFWDIAPVARDMLRRRAEALPVAADQ
jgi:TolB-like protein